jgi:thiamine biosynthesis lipoprotein
MMERPRPETGVDLEGGAPGLETHRFAHEAMATVFEVVCTHEDPGYAAQAAQAAFALLDRLERELSRFLPNSDVSRVNALDAGQGTRVTPTTMECLEIARRMYDLTDRTFDVSIGSGLHRLELRPDALEVRAHEAGARLDLGGIGKGYAVDRMAEELEEWDVVHVLVHGGYSSVLALEPPEGREGWPLTLTAPDVPDAEARVRLSVRRQALSASGIRKGEHIRDPRTGRAAPGRAAWVLLARASEADASGPWGDAVSSPASVAEALSTAFMVLSPEEIEALCGQGPAVEGWVVRDEPGSGARLVHYP